MDSAAWHHLFKYVNGGGQEFTISTQSIAASSSDPVQSLLLSSCGFFEDGINLLLICIDTNFPTKSQMSDEKRQSHVEYNSTITS